MFQSPPPSRGNQPFFPGPPYGKKIMFQNTNQYMPCDMSGPAASERIWGPQDAGRFQPSSRRAQNPSEALEPEGGGRV